MGDYSEIRSEEALERALRVARGSYQRDVILGREALSGATLRGKAARFGDVYARSRKSLIRRLCDAGIPVSERRGPHGKRILVIG